MQETVLAPTSSAWTERCFPPSSLLIASRNRPKLLAETIASILQGDELPTELIIIDQSDVPDSTLASLTTSRSCTIRYVWSQVVGLSSANNLGIATASYDVLVFTHDDVLVTPSWFATLVGALVETGSHSVVTGQVRLGVENRNGFQSTIKVDKDPAVYTGRVNKDVLLVLNMAIYRSAFTDIGTFDEHLGPGTPFRSAEDNDFGFRLLEAGYQIMYVPEAVLYHRAWRSDRDYLSLRWSYAIGQGAFLTKHINLHDRYILRRLCWEIVRRVRRLPHRVWWRDRAGVSRDMVYVLGMIYGAVRWLLTQRKIG